MNKNHTPKGRDETNRDYFQMRLKNLFVGSENPPTPLSLRQVEALEVRIAELEAQLAGQTDVDKPVAPTVAQQTTFVESHQGNSAGQSKPATSQRRAVRFTEKPEAKSRNAFLIATLIAVAHFLAAPYYLYLTSTTHIARFGTLAIITVTLSLLFGVGAWLSKRGRPQWGTILVLTTLSVSYPPIAVLARGIGLVLGAALMVAGPMIAFQLLARKSGWTMAIVSVVAGLASVLLDITGSVARPFLPGMFIQLLAISVIGVLIFSIIRQFRSYPLGTKLMIIAAIVFIVIASVQFQISSVRARQQVEAQAAERLSGYYQTYVGHVTAESNAAGALASSIAARADVQELFLKKDRQGLYELLLPMFEDLKEREIVHLYIENPDGTVFLRVHNPENFGDDVTYRGTAADALALKETTAGIEMGPNRLGVRGVSPMYSGEQFIGLIEVGLDFDQEFLANLKDLTGADFTMWVTYESAAIANLKPAEGIPAAPTEKIFYYASTSAQSLPVDPELYRSTLATRNPGFLAITENTSTPSIVYLTPLLGYKDRSFGVLEISFPYAETLAALRASQVTSLGVVGGLALIGLLMILFATSRFVLKPIESLAHFANLQMTGDTSIRVRMSSGDEFEHLANTFNSLANAVEDERRALEQRVAERTHDIELASEVSRAVSQKISDLSMLLKESVILIRNRFDLYYTQIYLTDPTGRTLILRAGTGEVGEELVRRGHQLLIGPGSLNGRAAAENRTVLVTDTGEDPNFLPNSLLSKTRSEMAVPLIANGTVVGVLDMQSEQSGALNEFNLPVFEALAGQLAIALQNAALYAQAQEARLEMEGQVRGLTEKGWKEFLNGIERGQRIGYAFDQKLVLPLEEISLDFAAAANELRAPLQSTGASLGAIQMTNEPDYVWTSQDVEVTHAVASHLAQHLDNLRLLAQAESYRKEAEQALRRLTREGWETMQVRGDLAPGYVFDLNQVKPLTDGSNGHLKTFIKHPLIVRTEPIGELAVDGDDSSEEARTIMEYVARQLGDHIETLRLSQEIEKRAYELATVADVSTTASTLLDPDRLLQSVVDLTKERFGLYHTHIYILDKSWQTLLLAAGAGEVGRKMVADGWNIALNHESSIVAAVARSRKSLIANDVYHDKDSSFLSNRLLPDTRSEMGVPMIVGDKLLGVFDVQSDVVGHFTEEDANIYTTLAAQVGVALQNARLYVEQAATVTQLRELDRLKSSFLANMSHELRTPLNSILGFADVMLEGLDGELTAYMDNDLRLIQKNGQHLLYLINDVLDMAKIESGRMNLNLETFRLHKVLEEVASITSTLASEKNLALIIDENSDQELEIYADDTRLRQVMINLVNNSIKFTERGSIVLSAKAMGGARVLIKVQDTGIGIPPDKLEAVFQEFTQVDSSATRKVGGTGLGLPISRRLVEMHGGRLWAESTGNPDEGSKFYVELPIEASVTEVVEK